MFSFLESKAPTSKVHISNGALPRYVDPGQPPLKKKPYSTISYQAFTHTVQVILPEELYQVIGQDVLQSEMSKFQYSRIIMPLSALLEGDFFNLYIKTGNILMLSEGRPGIDDKYSLKDGRLRLDLAKERYERSGLNGKPISDGGRKHMKTRFSVEIDLRQPSMLHGKKGFERIVWAFKNVLNHAVTWLFYDSEEPSDCKPNPIFSDDGIEGKNWSSIASKERPISKHHPLTNSCLPTITNSKGVLLHDLDHNKSLGSNDSFEDWALDTHEWLGLVAVDSPRILKGDSIDPFLSRYEIPGNNSGAILNMVTLTWTGFIPADKIRALFIDISGRKELRKAGQNPFFFALSAYSFKTEVTNQPEGYTILYRPGEQRSTLDGASRMEISAQETWESRSRDYVLWEIQA